MAPKHHSRTFDSYSSEDRSDTEYRMESESESDSEEISNSKRYRRRSKNKRSKRIRKRGFQWHEDDEIIVLKELFEFSGKNASYTKAFYDFVKKRLSREVSMHQMSNKIHRLRKEYLENECRVKDDALKFSGPHNRKVFELSKRIWGANNNNNGGATDDADDAEALAEYLQEMEIDMNCLTPSCLEYLKKEWEVQMLMYIELLSKKWKFDAKLREVMSQISNGQTTKGFFHNI